MADRSLGHLSALLMAVALLAAACGTSVSDDVATDPTAEAPTAARSEATPDATPTPSPTTEPTAEPTATAEPTPEPSPTPVATPTPTPAPTSTSTPTPAPAALIQVAPSGPLAGVALGTDAEPAIAALIDQFGPPTADTGWNPGCPLDAAGDNERTVQWGNLRAEFLRSDGAEFLWVWGFDIRNPAPGGPDVSEVALPGAGQIGDPIGDLAAAAGQALVFDDVFGFTSFGGGYQVIASGLDATGASYGAYVPFIPLCE